MNSSEAQHIPLAPEDASPLPELETRQQAAEYTNRLLDVAQGKIDAAVSEARQRGLTDEEIADYVKEAVLDGHLPQIAERQLPLRDGRRPIFFVDDTLPTPIKETLRVFVNSEGARVRVREMKMISETMSEAGQLLLLAPQSRDGHVGEILSDNWRELVEKLHSVTLPNKES